MTFNSPIGRSLFPLKPINFGCELLSGYAFKSKDFSDMGWPVVKIKNIQNGRVTTEDSQCIPKSLITSKLRRFCLSNEDVLIAMTGQGSVGRVGRLDLKSGDAYLNQRVGKLVADEETLNQDYLFYVISTNEYESALFSAGSGSGQPNLSPTIIKSIEIPYPPYRTQCAIGATLKRLDDKIQLNHQINQTLEQIAQAIFKSWFVDFEPVKAKIAALEAGGREEDALLAAMQAISGTALFDADVSTAGAEEQLARLQAKQPEQYAELRATAELFPSAMQDSELGEIPEGWEDIQLGDILDTLETGARPKGGVGGIHEGVPSVGAENIIGVGNYLYRKEKFIPVEFFEKLKRGKVEHLDCLLYKDGGKPGDFRPRVSMFGCGFPYDKFAINEHVFRLRSERLGQPFLYFQIGHERVLADLRHRGAKAAIPGINQTDVKSIWIACPPADLAGAFNKIAGKLVVSILNQSKESLQLSDLRDVLLPKILSGELSISDAETYLAKAEDAANV